MADKANLRKLAEAATPGPWSTHSKKGDRECCQQVWCPDDIICLTQCSPESMDDLGDEQRFRNRDFIAASDPPTVLALLDELAIAEERCVEFATSLRDTREREEIARTALERIAGPDPLSSTHKIDTDCYYEAGPCVHEIAREALKRLS